MKKTGIAFIILLSMTFAIFSNSCATIVKGPTQKVTIDSNVPGADIYLNNKRIGQTPYTGPIPRGSDTTIVVSKPGYRNKTVTLNSSVEPIFFGNIICGGTTGSITDFATGSMYKYSSTIQIDLYPLQ